MEKLNNLILKIKLKYPLLNEQVIKKDILMDEIIYLFKDLFEEIKLSKYYLTGGIALSKCYQATKRLSEDIDLTVLAENKTQSKLFMKKIIEKIEKMDCSDAIKVTNKEIFKTSKRNFSEIELIYKEKNLE